MEEFLKELADWLSNLYVVPNVEGGHEKDHIERMLKLGMRIQVFNPMDPDEFTAAVWLHNVDRCKPLKPRIIAAGGIYPYVLSQLESSPFKLEARSRIADAVSRHGKKNDEPDDSPLLTALRIADKVDRLRLGNFFDGVFHRLVNGELLYDPDAPLDYKKLGQKPNLWRAQMWNLEWVGMLPNDGARDLIDFDGFLQFLQILKLEGIYIAEREGLDPALAEAQILEALGDYSFYYHFL